jgi:hypothetical protein
LPSFAAPAPNWEDAGLCCLMLMRQEYDGHREGERSKSTLIV